MNAVEIKLATEIARDYSIDVSQENYDVMFGFGCSDFTPITVSLRTVARMMRYQCCCMDGSWDYKQYNEDLPASRKNIRVHDLTVPELRAWLVAFVQQRLGLAQAA